MEIIGLSHSGSKESMDLFNLWNYKNYGIIEMMELPKCLSKESCGIIEIIEL